MTKSQHGGPRPNSGRRTRYKDKVHKTLSLWLTKEGRVILRQAAKRNKASMMDVVEYLLRAYGADAQLPPLPPRSSETA